MRGRVASRKTSEALGVSRCFLENQRSGARRKPKQVSPERSARSRANKRALPLTRKSKFRLKFKKSFNAKFWLNFEFKFYWIASKTSFSRNDSKFAKFKFLLVDFFAFCESSQWQIRQNLLFMSLRDGNARGAIQRNSIAFNLSLREFCVAKFVGNLRV